MVDAILGTSTETIPPLGSIVFNSGIASSNSPAIGNDVECHAAVVDLLTRLLSSNSIEAARTVAARLIAEHLQADFVAIGENGIASTPCSLAIVVGNNQPSNELRNDLEAALSECVATARAHRVGVNETKSSPAGFAHQRLARLLGNKAIRSVPLLAGDGRCSGALMVTWSDVEFPPQSVAKLDRFLSAIALPIAELFFTLQRSTPGKLAKRWSIVQEFLTIRRRQWCAAIAVVLILIGVVPVRFPVRAAVTIEPTVRRWVVAPFDAPLKHTHVIPGQTVKLGQLLLSVDCQEVSNKLASLRAEAERANSERSSHLSTGRLSEAAISGWNAKRIRSEIDLLVTYLERSEIRSPIDGVVLGDDLQRLEGSPLKLGQTLLEIAQIQKMHVEIEIPTDQILHVAKGNDVSVTVEAAGSIATLTLSRIHPRAEANEQGKYVFQGYAELPGINSQLMPGMRGSATIYGEYHPFGWCLFQRLWQRLRDWG